MSPLAPLPTVALACLIAGCSPSPQSGASNAPGAPATAERATRYEDALADATQAVRAAEARTQADSNGWVAREALALALLDRAQLTGSYEDYVAADRALEHSAARAARPGPCLAAARIHVALHRLRRAAAALAACNARVGANAGEQAELEGLAADVAFYEGRYDEALRGYRAALQSGESVAGLARLAQYHARTGAPTEAAALLDRAERIYHGTSARPLAWLALQRGLLALDAGRWDDALAHDLRAQRLMPGWWLAEEHVAEIHALRGELDVALSSYRDIVQRTGHPEYMDAIARILLEQHQPAEAAAWIGRARAVYRERLKALPEAAAGHAIEHFLLFEPLERDELLAVARQDLAARPGAEARMHMAQAYLRIGRGADAAAALAPVLASPWQTAKLHALAAQVFAATHDGAAAARAEAHAVAMNPHARRMYATPPPAGDS